MDILWYLIVAIVYSVAIGLRKMIYNKEKFNVKKVLKTIIAGVIAGICISRAGVELSPENVEKFLTSFGVVAAADTIATWALKAFKSKQ